jgi:TrmH family RNA methyltransferase
VIGNEGNGIDRELLKRADEIITIPMAGNTESLNAAVSAGILMYERIRRR